MRAMSESRPADRGHRPACRPKNKCHNGLGFVTEHACATSAFAQSGPNSSTYHAHLRRFLFADSEGPECRRQKEAETGAEARPSSARTNPSAAAGPAPSQAPDTAQGTQAQNPLTPLWGVMNENYTNFSMGPLQETQTSWSSSQYFRSTYAGLESVNPLEHAHHRYARLAEPLGPSPELARSSVSVTCSRSSSLRQHIRALHFCRGTLALVTDCDRQDIGNRQVGWRAGRRRADDPGTFARRFLAQNIWAGRQGEPGRAAGQHATIMPFVFYNFPVAGS